MDQRLDSCFCFSTVSPFYTVDLGSLSTLSTLVNLHMSLLFYVGLPLPLFLLNLY